MDYQAFQQRLCNPGSFCPDDLLGLLQDCTATCHNCHLGTVGSRAVLGSGPASARLMIVGGESSPEDEVAGRPFSGPAGQALREAIARTGIGQPDVYLTNAVKHAGGWDGTHAGSHQLGQAIAACREWIQGEMAVVKPEVVLCLGEIAAESVLGHTPDLPAQRGRIFHPGFVPTVIVTVSASSLIDQPDPALRERALRDLVIELHKVVEVLGEFDPFRGREALAQL